jgi:hypothetical protein
MKRTYIKKNIKEDILLGAQSKGHKHKDILFEIKTHRQREAYINRDIKKRQTER